MIEFFNSPKVRPHLWTIASILGFVSIGFIVVNFTEFALIVLSFVAAVVMYRMIYECFKD